MMGDHYDEMEDRSRRGFDLYATLFHPSGDLFFFAESHDL